VDRTIEKSAKLSDVAKAAGVSQGTVSNVFNRPQIVREEVREHVRTVARKLGYHGGDPRGRLLRAGKVNAIGVATTEPLAFFFTDPFARVLMTGITGACDANGAGISLVSAASEEELTWNVRNALVDGLILYCLDGADRLIELARERQLPYVALSLGLADHAIPAVGIDNLAAARSAARHLTNLGHKRLAILTMKLTEGGSGPRSIDDVTRTIFTASRDRVLGYLEALAAAGIDTDGVPIYETQSDPATVHAALDVLFAAPTPPTAILAESDKIALVALDWLSSRGISVPDDVSIIGFDGVPEGESSSPPLTTMAQPIAEIGRRAVKMIVDFDGKPRREAVNVELIVRRSTAPPPQATSPNASASRR
jgi:DNA-binding LacI/PurR family transcriptional regulator